MRELLYKNLTCVEKGRKILSVRDESQKNGFLTRTYKKFIYLIRDTGNLRAALVPPSFYILKIHDTKNSRERFIFKVKGNFYVVNSGQVRVVYFCHSFKIDLLQLSSSPQQSPTNC